MTHFRDFGSESLLRSWNSRKTDCCCSVAKSCLTLCNSAWTAARQASLSFPIFPSLLKLMSTESMMPSKHLIPCHPLLLLPSVFPRNRVFTNKSALHITWPKYWSFSFSISPSSGYSGLISFRIGWFDLLAVQRTQESFPTPQLKSIYSSVLSLLYGPTVKSVHDYRKTIAFRQSFVSKVMSVLFNTLSRFIIAFLPRRKCLLISRLQSPSAVNLEPRKIKYVTASIVSPSIYHDVMGLDAMILVFWTLSFKPAF